MPWSLDSRNQKYTNGTDGIFLTKKCHPANNHSYGRAAAIMWRNLQRTGKHCPRNLKNMKINWLPNEYFQRPSQEKRIRHRHSKVVHVSSTFSKCDYRQSGANDWCSIVIDDDGQWWFDNDKRARSILPIKRRNNKQHRTGNHQQKRKYSCKHHMSVETTEAIERRRRLG